MNIAQSAEEKNTEPHERFWTIQNNHDVKAILQSLDSLEKIESFYTNVITDKFNYSDLSSLQASCLGELDFARWWRTHASTQEGRNKLSWEVDTSTRRGIELRQNKAFRQVMATPLPEPTAQERVFKPEPPHQEPNSFTAPLPQAELVNVLYEICTIHQQEFRIYECGLPSKDEYGQVDMTSHFAHTFQAGITNKNVIYKAYHRSSSKPIFVSKSLPTQEELYFQLQQREAERTKSKGIWIVIIIGLIVIYQVFG